MTLNGAPGWQIAGRHHAFDPIGPVAVTPAVIDPETGETVTPSVFDHR